MKSEPPRASAFTPFLRRFTDERARDLTDTIALHRRVTARHRASIWSHETAVEKVFGYIVDRASVLVEMPRSRRALEALYTCLIAIVAQETTIFTTLEIDWDHTSLSLQEQVDLKCFLRAQEYFLDHEDVVSDELATALTNLIAGLIGAMPTFEADAPEQTAAFSVPLYALLGDVHDVVDRAVGTLMKSRFADLGLFTQLQAAIYSNACHTSGVPVDAEPKKPLISPADSKLPPAELVEAYLRNTPLFDLFMTPVPFALPQSTRFEHMHIVAGSGHGKTQTLQHLILRDLNAVAAGNASIVVIDSQSDLINTIAGLQLFAPGQPLSERLVLIDPTDLEWPVALNLFDAGLDRLDQYSPLDRERLTNSVLELYDFVLGSLLDAGMTQKQTVIFRYITRLLLRIPGATIHTLRALLEDGGADQYREYITKLTGSARAFFDNKFDGKEFAATKRQVLRRLYGILENQTFERMFSHPKSKLDLFAEMNAGKVILINTAKDLLKENGTEIFGRFFIAMIAQAAHERAVLKPEERLPTFVYIDEASDYFDRNIGIILSQARKRNIGIVAAHQYLGQLEPKLHEAIAANTAIKFAGGVSAKDARASAGDLRTDAGFIERQPKLSFAAYVKGLTREAVSLTIQPGQMEGLPRMSAEDRERLRELMRTRYAVHHSELDAGEQQKHDVDDDIESATNRQDSGEPMAWD